MFSLALKEDLAELENNTTAIETHLEKIAPIHTVKQQLDGLKKIKSLIKQLDEIDYDLCKLTENLQNALRNSIHELNRTLVILINKSAGSTTTTFLQNWQLLTSPFFDFESKANTVINRYKEQTLTAKKTKQLNDIVERIERAETEIHAITETYIAEIAQKVLAETKEDIAVADNIVLPAKNMREKEIESYKRASRTWLGLAGITTLMTLAILNAFYKNQGITLFGYVFYSPLLTQDGHDTNAYAPLIREVSYKVFSLTVLTSLIFFNLKQYNLNKNMQLHAEHKKQALDSFKDFMEATHTEQEARKVILNKTLSAVYYRPEFGYINHDKKIDKADIFELLKIIKSDGKE